MSESNSLRGKKPSQTYKDILHISNNNNGLDSVLRNIYDGDGNILPIKVSTVSSEIECGGEEIIASSILNTNFYDSIFYDPVITFDNNATLHDSSFGIVDLWERSGSYNGFNCSKVDVNAGAFNIPIVQENMSYLQNFSTNMTTLTVEASVGDDEAFCFVGLMNPSAFSITGSFSSFRNGGASPISDTNFGNGPGIFTLFYINETGSSSSTLSLSSESYVVLNAQNLSQNGAIPP